MVLSLLSSTLSLGQSDQNDRNLGSSRPVFGLPFSFGKPLVFNTAPSSENIDCCSYDASTNKHACSSSTKHKKHSINNAAETPEAKKAVSSMRMRRLTSQSNNGSSSSRFDQAGTGTTAACTHQQQHYQHHLQQVGGASCSSNGIVRAAAEGLLTAVPLAAATASQYYLGSLGAALAQGCAGPAAAAAAAAATAKTATQLAIEQFSKSACNMLPELPSDSKFPARRIRHKHSTAAGPQQSSSSNDAATAAVAVAAAAAAAAAACSGCSGCKLMLERLQHCSRCSNAQPPGACGSSDSRCLGGPGPNSNCQGVQRKAADSEDAKQQWKDDTPGPGAYSLPSSFGQQGVAFTMGAKPAATAAAAAAGKAAAEDMPGPGTYYNPRAGSAGGPAFSMAGRWRQHGQEAAAPGPGEHQQLQFI